MDSASCRNCGNQLIQGARFCPRCGVATAEGPPSAIGTSASLSESYQPPEANQQQPYYHQPSYQQPPYQQPSYQQPIYQQPSFGQPNSPQPYFPQPPGVAPALYYPEPKDKSVAVLLAVFLGCWTWVYTYKKDAWKFWLCLGLNLTVFNPLWTVFILLLPNIGLWLWSIVDVAAKHDQFYRNYPNS